MYTEPKSDYQAPHYTDTSYEEEGDSSYHCQPPSQHHPHPHPLFPRVGDPADEYGESAGLTYINLSSCHEDMPMNLVTEVHKQIFLKIFFASGLGLHLYPERFYIMTQ